MAPDPEDELTAELTERSDGNFMYLVHVLPELASGRLDLRANGPGEGLALPQGLRGYYEQHWRSMKSGDERSSAVGSAPCCASWQPP